MKYLTSTTELRRLGNEYGIKMPNHPFKNYNFMTRDIQARRKAKGHGCWFELSMGRGMSGGTLYGVTFTGCFSDHSTCCDSIEEVEALLESVLGDN